MNEANIVAWMVEDCEEGFCGIFQDYLDAKDSARDCAANNNCIEWDVIPLYAGEPKSL